MLGDRSRVRDSPRREIADGAILSAMASPAYVQFAAERLPVGAGAPSTAATACGHSWTTITGVHRHLMPHFL